MKKMIGLIGILTCLQSFSQKVVFVIADGIPADIVEHASMPNLHKIIIAGSYTRSMVGGIKDSYSMSPTISAVGYNSLLTGTWVNKHNVWDNDIKAPNYHYPTIFRLFKDQYPEKKVAVFSTWQDNRTKLLGEQLQETHNLKLDIARDGYELDTVHFPHDKASTYIHIIDDTVVQNASRVIREQAPDLSWVYLEYTDDIGHRYGDSPQRDAALAYLDTQIGWLWNAIAYRKKKYKEDWLIIITTDHGRDEKTGRGHGGQSFRERSSWILMNKQMNSYAQHSYPAIVDILPTIAHFMKLDITRDTRFELDGNSLLGKVSVSKPVLHQFTNKLDLTWQPYDTTGTVKIWLTTTNHIKEGGKDNYELVAEVPICQKYYDIDLTNKKSDFYKVVLEGKYNCSNAWQVNK